MNNKKKINIFFYDLLQIKDLWKNMRNILMIFNDISQQIKLRTVKLFFLNLSLVNFLKKLSYCLSLTGSLADSFSEYRFKDKVVWEIGCDDETYKNRIINERK